MSAIRVRHRASNVHSQVPVSWKSLTITYRFLNQLCMYSLNLNASFPAQQSVTSVLMNYNVDLADLHGKDVPLCLVCFEVLTIFQISDFFSTLQRHVRLCSRCLQRRTGWLPAPSTLDVLPDVIMTCDYGGNVSLHCSKAFNQ